MGCVMRKIARQSRDCIIGAAQRWDPQELLDGRGKLVWPVFGERVERVAQACLSENLERGAPHPVQHVYLRGRTPHALDNGRSQLRAQQRPGVGGGEARRTEATATGKQKHDGISTGVRGPDRSRNTDLVADVVEHRHHVAHMIYGEDGVKHTALLAMMVSCVK